MPKASKTTSTNHRSLPYPRLNTPPMHQPATPPDSVLQERPKMPDRSIPTAATTWLSDQDDILMRARQQGENWQPIATKYFPEKSGNACRKRHERLMERRNTADSWDGAKLARLAVAYNDCREQMWKTLGHSLGEKWQVVEAKCMEKGLKNLQNAARNAAKAKRPHDESNQLREHSYSENSFGVQRSRSLSDDLGSEQGSGPGPDYSPFEKRPRVSTNEEDRPPYSIEFHTPNRTFSGSTTSLSVTGVTPTMSAAPVFPFFAPSPTEDTQPRPPVVDYQAPESSTTLPSFGELVGNRPYSSLPSQIAEKRLPRHPPHSPS